MINLAISDSWRFIFSRAMNEKITSKVGKVNIGLLWSLRIAIDSAASVTVLQASLQFLDIILLPICWHLWISFPTTYSPFGWILFTNMYLFLSMLCVAKEYTYKIALSILRYARLPMLSNRNELNSNCIFDIRSHIILQM